MITNHGRLNAAIVHRQHGLNTMSDLLVLHITAHLGGNIEKLCYIYQRTRQARQPDRVGIGTGLSARYLTNAPSTRGYSITSKFIGSCMKGTQT